MSNHLIIGLGGTGGKVIRSIRKAIYRDWREPAARNAASSTSSDKVAAATPPGVKIDYLYLDSSDEHMRFDDDEWKVLGENLQLDPASQIELRGTNVGTIFEDIDGHKNIAPWIGPKKDWGSVLNLGGGGAKVLGGQKRRLGRLLFAMHAPDFMAKVAHKVNSLKEGAASAKIEFHLVCGLAGGTGSGTLIDAVALIRNKFPDTQNYPIMLYLLLPEELPKAGWDSGNYHANGYAALMELNALAVGAYRPYDLLGRGDRVKSLSAPFKVCYLISNENSTGKPFEVDRQIPDLLAEMIYQKIVAAKTGVSREIGRIIEWENRVAEHEGLEGQSPERCWMFASFGIKKIAYPEDEIRDYVGYALASQTLRKMLYNNWAQGYLNEPSKTAIEGYVADDKVRMQLNLDRPVFFLERRFSFDEQDKDQESWKSLDAEWRTYIMRVAEDVRSEDGNWLDLLRRKCEERENEKFRSSRGVAAYYAWKTDLINQYARSVVDGVDGKLAEDLFEGRRSLVEIEGILRTLCEALERENQEWARWVDKQQEEAARKRTLWSENLQRFGDLGPLARMIPGNMDRIFEAGRDAMIDYHVSTTYVRAWPFAERLMRTVRVELGRLADRTAKAAASLKVAEQKCAEHAQNHKPLENGKESTDVVMRLYNGDEVTRYVSSIIGSQTAQTMQSRQAQDRMRRDLMAGRTSLRALPVDKNREILDILAQAAHDTLTGFDIRVDRAATDDGGDLPELDRLLNVSIIDKLEERYAGNTEEMRREIREYMGRAAWMLRFNEAEVGKSGPGYRDVDQNNRLVSSLVIMLPEAETEREFVSELKRVFREAVPNAGAAPLFIDTARTRRHEITILSFVQLFPQRYLNMLPMLRDRYESRVRDGGQAFVLHTEGTAADFPPLFVKPMDQVVGPTILLSIVLGSVRPKSKAGGVPGTLRDLLVRVDADDVPAQDLGIGFNGSISRAGDCFKEIRAENLRRAALKLGDESAGETVKQALKERAREIAAGDDDELRRMIDIANQAHDEFTALVAEARKNPNLNH